MGSLREKSMLNSEQVLSNDPSLGNRWAQLLSEKPSESREMSLSTLQMVLGSFEVMKGGD
jgi:hypothetical protein